MQAKETITKKLRQLSKRQVLRIVVGLAVLIALLLILWPAAG